MTDDRLNEIEARLQRVEELTDPDDMFGAALHVTREDVPYLFKRLDEVGVSLQMAEAALAEAERLIAQLERERARADRAQEALHAVQALAEEWRAVPGPDDRETGPGGYDIMDHAAEELDAVLAHWLKNGGNG